MAVNIAYTFKFYIIYFITITNLYIECVFFTHLIIYRELKLASKRQNAPKSHSLTTIVDIKVFNRKVLQIIQILISVLYLINYVFNKYETLYYIYKLNIIFIVLYRYLILIMIFYFRLHWERGIGLYNC